MDREAAHKYQVGPKLLGLERDRTKVVVIKPKDLPAKTSSERL
jgi:hypothetical protein